MRLRAMIAMSSWSTVPSRLRWADGHGWAGAVGRAQVKAVRAEVRGDNGVLQIGIGRRPADGGQGGTLMDAVLAIEAVAGLFARPLRRLFARLITRVLSGLLTGLPRRLLARLLRIGIVLLLTGRL